MGDKVVIVGGGAIGLATAYYLLKKNRRIVLIDKGDFGQEASKGNMGWVCPLLAEPVPSPGLIKTSFKWMFKKDSPLYISPFKMPFMSKWLLDFWGHSNETDYKKGEAALHELQKHTFSLFDDLEEDGLNFEMYKDGFIFLFSDKKELNNTLEKIKVRANKLKMEQPVILSPDEVKKMEPNVSSEISGAIYLKDQRHIRPESLWSAMINHLKSYGVEFQTNTEVIDFKIKRKKVIAVKTRDGYVDGDEFLVSAGAWSRPLLKKAGYNIPIQAGKGYSITLSNPSFNINHPMYLGESKVGISPFGNEIRLGGTMELSGNNLKLNEERIKSIRASATKYLPQDLIGDAEIKWTGMRPMTPDGLPIIDKLPKIKNMFLASGHNMEGVSLSLITGKIMSELITSKNEEHKFPAFKANRFKLK